MPLPRFIAFTAVPLRARCDGWSPELQLRFVEALAGGAKPGAAARAVGKNRQNAYALRRRPGAESFAAAWDAAVDFARSERLSRLAQERQERQIRPPIARTHGQPNFPHFPRGTVAFRSAALRRGPC